MSAILRILTSFLLICPFIQLSSQKIKTREFVVNSPGGFQISGQVDYPDSKGKHPAAILIWGNGPHTRDQVISGSPMFKQISDYLVHIGIAVLRFDKRGHGKSTGRFQAENNYTTADLAGDVALALEFLARQSFIDTSRIGLMGHSEGATIAAMTAAGNHQVDWIIVFGPQAVTGHSILAEQTRQNRERLGFTKSRSDSVGKVWEKYFAFLKSDPGNDSLYYSIGREFLMAHGLDQHDKRITNEFINQLLSGYKSEWNRYFLKTNPTDYYRQIMCPLLAIFGGEDRQTSVPGNLPPLNRALSEGSNKLYSIVVLADEDHFFLRHNNQRIEKHVKGEMKMSGHFLQTLTDWLIWNRIIDK